MYKPDPRTLAPSSDIPEQYFMFKKNNDPNGQYLVYEIWENGYPDEVVAEQKLTFSPKTFGESQIDKIIPFWKKLGKELKDPILTIQADEGNGSELMYGFKDKREGIPANAKFYTIKPVFDKNIMKMRHGGKQGRSLVLHSPLASQTLHVELSHLNRLLVRFFEGEHIDFGDRTSGWEFRRETIIDNTKL